MSSSCSLSYFLKTGRVSFWTWRPPFGIDWTTIKVSLNWLLKSFVSRKKKSMTYEKCKFHRNCFNWLTMRIELQSRTCHFRAGCIPAALWPLGLATWKTSQPPTRGRKGSFTVFANPETTCGEVFSKVYPKPWVKDVWKVSALLLPVQRPLVSMCMESCCIHGFE